MPQMTPVKDYNTKFIMGSYLICPSSFNNESLLRFKWSTYMMHMMCSFTVHNARIYQLLPCACALKNEPHPLLQTILQSTLAYIPVLLLFRKQQSANPNTS